VTAGPAGGRSLLYRATDQRSLDRQTVRHCSADALVRELPVSRARRPYPVFRSQAASNKLPRQMTRLSPRW